MIEKDMNNRNSTSKLKETLIDNSKTRKKREELSISATKSIKKEDVEIVVKFNWHWIAFDYKNKINDTSSQNFDPEASEAKKDGRGGQYKETFMLNIETFKKLKTLFLILKIKAIK